MSNQKDYLVLKTRHGESLIELYSDKAPHHVARLLKLAQENFYNGLKFHRVIEGFMAQTGCPKGNGTGGSDLPNLKAEFNDLHHDRGVVSMARSQDPHSANSQFFIMFKPAPHLDGQYTACGKVIRGMDKIDSIKKGNPYDNGSLKASEADIIDELYIPDQNTLTRLLDLEA